MSHGVVAGVNWLWKMRAGVTEDGVVAAGSTHGVLEGLDASRGAVVASQEVQRIKDAVADVTDVTDVAERQKGRNTSMVKGG